MKKYFYSDGKEKHGPFSLEELKQENIEKDTLIWFEGLEDWKQASEVEEIISILEITPPPIISEKNELELDSTAEDKNEDSYQPNDTAPNKVYSQGMFSIPFSFDGRIRRTEYGISLIIYVIAAIFVNVTVESGEVPIIGLAYIPMLWFLWAQGAKRCHDIGNNGWFQIIPFYVLWMIFASGTSGINEYGLNPKG